MARLSVRFIETEREECIIRLSRLIPQMLAAENSEMEHMTYLIQHMIQRMVQRQHFSFSAARICCAHRFCRNTGCTKIAMNQSSVPVR